jgi:succinate dehydrogenase/fumarate reductase flavoprotein subunit
MSQTKQYDWQYPIRYGKEKEINTDVLILGGGIAGCWAAIAAAKKGAKVVILEVAATMRSGAGGPGCDHWSSAITNNPCCTLTADEWVQALYESSGGYTNSMAMYITARESYDILMELEQMGAKVRDTEDEFKGAEFRDEKTKLLFAYDYTNNHTIRVWGTTFKPVLYKECKRLGVEVHDRVMATSLLTEGGKQGARVIGATGVDARTGEFIVAKAKSTISCLGNDGREWHSSTEASGFGMRSGNTSGGAALAWRAGAEFTLMEGPSRGSAMEVSSGVGAGRHGNTWFACTLVDANGKELPWVDRDGRVLKTVAERYRPAPGQKFFLPAHFHSTVYDYIEPSTVGVEEMVAKGEITLPIYADLTNMPEDERRVIWGVMVGEESRSKVTLKYYTEAGFDPTQDMLEGYQLRMSSESHVASAGRRIGRMVRAGGLVVDWDLKTTLDGLYAAGNSLFAHGAHPEAAATGKYAGRKAAENARQTTGALKLNRQQVELEKHRVYGPTKRKDGIEWKELNQGINKVMQFYCGDPKEEKVMKLGLKLLDDISAEVTANSFATDPHKLARTLEVMDILTFSKIIINACLARKASSTLLGLRRWDYPEVDPEEWHKFITIKETDGEVQVGEIPIGFWGDLAGNYAAHCGLQA